MVELNAKQNIPSGWKLKKLSDVLDYERPDAYIVKSTNYSDKAKTPVLTANKSFVLGYTDEDFGIYENVPAIIFDDFTTDSKFVDFPFKIKSSAIKILKGKSKDIDLRFVFEKMKSVNFPTGSHKRFYISQYQNLEIATPPINEQQKIAEILGMVDEDIAKTQKVIEATEKLKRGLMQQLFTRGIGHIKFKETKIGQIPDGWDIVLLDTVARRGSGHTPNKKIPEYYNGGVKWISLADSKSLDRGKISQTKIEISQEGLNNSSAVLHPKGTVLLSRDAGIGKSAVMAEDMAVSQHFITWTCEDNLSNWYLYYYLQFQKKVFERIAMGSTIKTIGLDFFKKFVMPLSAIPEQKKIAGILSAVDEKISVNKKLKAKLTLLKKGLMQDLLSGKVRTIS